MAIIRTLRRLFSIMTWQKIGLVVTVLCLAFPVFLPFTVNQTFSTRETAIVTATSNFAGLMFGFLTALAFYYLSSRPGDLYRRVVDILPGSEIAGLDRVERDLLTGTSAISACERSHHTIDFMGVGGRKFLEEILKEDKGVGRRIASGQIRVRIMLLDPGGGKLGEWTNDKKKSERVRADIRKTLARLAPKLRNNVRCRLYDFFPPLRILIIDNSHVLVSRYDPASKDGWDAPQLCFSNRPSPGPEFPTAFVNLYELLWSTGRDHEVGVEGCGGAR
ncbi:MAG TPA: hypothetical protein VF559_08260 [Caulobacteraceae bacterium]|jgi:hypothetical protein